jgi:hypothetical protein
VSEKRCELHSTWTDGDDLQQRVEQWYHIPAVAATVSTLIGVHFLSVPELLAVGLIVDFGLAILKYFVVSPFEVVYLTIGHSIVLWVWSGATLVYFVVKGTWWLGAYALGYHVILSTVIGLPGIFLVDSIAGLLLGCNPKYWAARKFSVW